MFPALRVSLMSDCGFCLSDPAFGISDAPGNGEKAVKDPPSATATNKEMHAGLVNSHPRKLVRDLEFNYAEKVAGCTCESACKKLKVGFVNLNLNASASLPLGV